MKLGRRAFLSALGLVTPWLRGATPAQSPLDAFLTLSSRLTGYADLDPKIGGVLLNRLLAAPDTAARVARPDAALERDIIVAWYTGVQTVHGETRLVTHEGALQWRALQMPAPGVCAVPFGAWAKPPRMPQP